MEQVFSPVGLAQPIPTIKTGSVKKLVLWVLGGIVSLIIGGIGVYFYYLEFYQPPLDARQIIVLHEDIEEFSRLLENQGIQDALDYPQTLNVLEKRAEFLLRTQDKLGLIKPRDNIFPATLSPRAQKVTLAHQTLANLIEMGVAANADAKQKTLFLKDAYDLLVALGRYSPRVQQAQPRENLLDPRQPRAVKAILGDWETRIAKAKELGNSLFAKDIPQLNQADSSQLTTAWKKANAGFDDVLAYLRSKDPESTISSPSTLPLPQTTQDQQQYPGVADVDAFIILLESILNGNVAQDILSYRFYNRQPDLENIGLEFETQITDLRQLYSLEDQFPKSQRPKLPPL